MVWHSKNLEKKLKIQITWEKCIFILIVKNSMRGLSSLLEVIFILFFPLHHRTHWYVNCPNTDELDTITSNMGTIFSNTLETVAPIKLKKVREKRDNSYTHSL